jgi:hypothetical protein
MIRYATLRGKPLTLAALRDAVQTDLTKHDDPDVRKAVAGWLDRAKERTDQLVAAGKYLDLKKWKKLSVAEKVLIPKPIAVDWSSVKYLFMEIQNEKCAYCERKLAASGEGGAAEHDLEHFRTKNPVKAWPAPAEIDFSTGSPSDPGYYWLAFHLLNYCTACKKCNTGLKSNYFPVAGTRAVPHAIPGRRLHATERPFLIYPLGTGDDDPEAVIRFRGIAAFPPEKDPLLSPRTRSHVHRNRRARVVIAFFDLNGRQELLWGRAERLRDLEKALADLNDPGTPTGQRTAAKNDIERLTDGFSEHTACVRGMIRLYQKDVATARQFFDAVRAYLDSKTPKTYFEQAGKIVETPSPASRRSRDRKNTSSSA